MNDLFFSPLEISKGLSGTGENENGAREWQS
jgi:hypothetical protein